MCIIPSIRFLRKVATESTEVGIYENYTNNRYMHYVKFNLNLSKNSKINLRVK